MKIPTTDRPTNRMAFTRDITNPTTPPDQFVVPPFTVLYDHREREGGWRFGGLLSGADQKYRPLLVKTREVHLVTADYTLEDETGERVPCYVERKSHDDLIGSCGGGNSRLRAEHERMQAIIASGGHCAVVIETSLDRVIEELSDVTSTRKLDPSSVMGIVASWPSAYGVPWHFAATRRLAEELSYRIMAKFYERWTEQHAMNDPASSPAPALANLF